MHAHTRGAALGLRAGVCATLMVGCEHHFNVYLHTTCGTCMPTWYIQPHQPHLHARARHVRPLPPPHAQHVRPINQQSRHEQLLLHPPGSAPTPAPAPAGGGPCCGPADGKLDADPVHRPAGCDAADAAKAAREGGIPVGTRELLPWAYDLRHTTGVHGSVGAWVHGCMGAPCACPTPTRHTRTHQLTHPRVRWRRGPGLAPPPPSTPGSARHTHLHAPPERGPVRWQR